jgi:DNA replication and repair protein RecF
VSVLAGGKGVGKTNLLEAAAYLATLGSHRVATDGPLVRRGADRAVLRSEIISGGSGSVVEIEINPGRANRARLNRAPVQRPRQVLGVLRTVLFAPEDLALVKGDPEQRRRFLDDLLATSAPRYAAVRSDYERVLRQRTALLKSLRGRAPARTLAAVRRRGRADSAPGEAGAAADGEGSGAALNGVPGPAPRLLEVWDDQLAMFGAELLAGRIGLTAALAPLVTQAYHAVSGSGAAPNPGAAICYRQSLPGGGGNAAGAGGGTPSRAELAGHLRGALARVRGEEIERGVCLVGPHRDDLELQIGELPARGYASQGESWSMALALRLAAYELLRSAGDDPVLLLDDVFAELDEGRRARLAGVVGAAEQVIVTAAVPGDVPDVLTGARFTVAGGTVTRAG